MSQNVDRIKYNVPKVIAVDFDGTCCDHEFPNIGKIKSGCKEALELFHQLGYKIIIWSCRTCSYMQDVFSPPEDLECAAAIDRNKVKEMKQWLDANCIHYDEIDDGTKGKPVADFYIDDKAIRFSNNWVEIGNFIRYVSARNA